MDKILIIDFDSTFVTVEVMDELAAVALGDSPDREEIVAQVRETTQLGMEGKIPFDESLRRRVSLLRANKSHVEELIRDVKEKISPSIEKNKEFFQTYCDSIYIISGGFKEVIAPVVADFGIDEKNIFANTFCFDAEGNITDVDNNNFLSQEGGKVKQIKALGLVGEIYIIGDGFTDYQIKEAGLATKFIAYTENVTRPTVVEKSDYAVSSFDGFLEKENLTNF